MVGRFQVWGSLIVLGCTVLADAAHAASYYVAKGGQDAYSCAQAQSASTPKSTINGGVRCLAPGDTLYVRGGVYSESLINNIPPGNSWSTPVRIVNYPGDTVTMQPTGSAYHVLEFYTGQHYIEIDGINLDGSNVQYGPVKINYVDEARNAHHIRIKNLTIRTRNESVNGVHHIGVLATAGVSTAVGGNEFINLDISGGNSHAFYLQSSNNLVEFCDVHDITKAGVTLYNGNAPNTTNNNIIRYNIFRDFTRPPSSWDDNNPAVGVNVDMGGGNQVYGNLVYNITRTTGAGGLGTTESVGIDSQNATDTEIYNNTVVNVSGIGVWIAAGSGHIVRNNISYGNRQNYWNAGASTIADHNFFQTVNPQFVNPSGGNFQLQAGSPAVDAGALVGAVTKDLNGAARPQGNGLDIGAYEYGSTNGPSGPYPPTNVRLVSN